MPKVKDGKPYQKGYNEDDIEKALVAIQGGLSKKAAAKLYRIPRPTLIFRLSNKFKKKEPGPSPVLTHDEEATLVKWIINNHMRGFPRRKEDIQASVKEFLDKNPRENPFRNNMPGDGWFKAFLKRHPCITQRTSEAVTSASANVGETDIRKWFSNISSYLKEQGYFEILEDSTRIFNGDETCFMLCPKGNKVLAPKGVRNVYETDCGQAKASLTVMFTFCANGDITPPMIIYPNKRRNPEITRSLPDDWGYGLSENGWMKAECFYEYVANILHPHLKKKGTKFPIIFFVDGHATHLTYELSQLCTDLGIILISLYPNSTRILQPADVAAFKPLKNAWKKGVLEWRRSNPTEALTKEKFAPILKIVVDTSISKSTIINGFRSCGLYPFNENAIDYTKCLGKSTIHDEKNRAQFPDNEEPRNKVLNLSSFQRIVGSDIVEDLKKNDTEKSEYFLSLRKLWQELSGTEHAESKKREDNSEIDTNVHILSHVLETNQNTTVLSEGEIEVNNDYLSFDITNLPITIEEEEQEKENSINKQVSDLHPAMSLITFNEESEIAVLDFVNSQLPTCLNQEGNSKEDEQINQNDLSVITTPSISETLYWPHIPERKGKFNSERMPFVITSAKWKELKNKKLTEKKEKEEAAMERKRKRLENKQEKKTSNSASTKTKRKCNNKPFSLQQSENLTNIISPEITPEITAWEENVIVYTGLCFCCVKNVDNNNPAIKCTTCQRKYHKKCLLKICPPSKLFMCTTCKKTKKGGDVM